VVISVATLAGPSAAGYYVQQQGCEHDHGLDIGYYVNEHEAEGRWRGGGAAALGLTGHLTHDSGEVLERLLAGQYAGQQLVGPVWRRDDTGERVDVRRAGFDVTFSAPKSVSVLMALGASDVAAQVVQAHQAAVVEALALLERLAARVARGHHGDGHRARRIRTSGLVAAGFEHTTSRANDPQLHTHVVIANLAQGVDGRWSALDSRTLHREATTASYLYQFRLRAELTERLGVAWTPVSRGVAEVDGVPLEVRRLFSTRRAQIEAVLHERSEGEPSADARAGAGATGGRGRARHLAARAACLLTRPAKVHPEPSNLRASWGDRARAVGFGPSEVAGLLGVRHESPIVNLDDLTAQALAADGVTREASTFAQGAVLRELIERLPGGAQVSTGELMDALATVMSSDEVMPVLSEDGPAYTTWSMLQTEEQTLAMATRPGPLVAQLDPAQAARAIVTAHGLRGDQQQVAFSLVRSGRPVDVLTGPAGCGKTAALAAATHAWHAAGYAVTGTAVAALTAQGLETASGAASVSLARLLHDPERHLARRGVLLVDEAGMIGTRQLHQLLTVAAERESKVVLVGDSAQLPELEAGGLFARLADESTALHLQGHGRQRHSWERAALSSLRAGHVEQALEAYQHHDRLHTSTDRDSLHEQAVAAYLEARETRTDPWEVVLLAANRDDVRDLNDLARRRLLVAGKLSATTLVVETDDGPTSYRIGDQVLVTRNDYGRGLLNGTTGTVTVIGEGSLTVRVGNDRQVQVDRAWLAAGHLAHGYAMTIHKSQGRTVHTGLLVGSSSMSTQAGYVGLSRGTEANHVFLRADDLAELAAGCGSRVQYLRRAEGPKARPLGRDVRQRLALDRIERREASTR
jgi:conjugative relaxase-like TrwC/TraI family protein